MKKLGRHSSNVTRQSGTIRSGFALSRPLGRAHVLDVALMDVQKLCAEVNQHATKMRVIRQQYEYEGQAALQEQQEAEQRKMLAEMGINL